MIFRRTPSLLLGGVLSLSCLDSIRFIALVVLSDRNKYNFVPIYLIYLIYLSTYFSSSFSLSLSGFVGVLALASMFHGERPESTFFGLGEKGFCIGICICTSAGVLTDFFVCLFVDLFVDLFLVDR